VTATPHFSTHFPSIHSQVSTGLGDIEYKIGCRANPRVGFGRIARRLTTE
jgi:hypothetical protein